MKKIIPYLLLNLVINTSIYSQIEQITIRWTPQLCQNYCTKLLERELRKVQGINEISIDQGSGQAILTWKEKVPFQYTSVNTAMHMVGLSMRDIRIKVTGAIKHTGEIVYIVSEGDNTRFELVNPVVPRPGGQAAEFNGFARKLEPGLKQKLLDGEAQKQIATVEGPVFMPERMTIPTQIVVDQLSFTSSTEKAKK